MIFATIGTQLPFPRLMAALDALAPHLSEPVIAQVGSDPGPYRHMDAHESLPAERFDTLFAQARVVVAHAGIGSILSARKHERPLILVPRRADLGEHRNDHQIATARELEHRAGLCILWDVADLGAALAAPPPPASPLGPHDASDGTPLSDLRHHLAGLIDGA